MGISSQKPDRTGGLVFDTGSEVTSLIGSVYNVLKQHVIDYFNQKYRLHPFTEDNFFLDLCYLNVPSNVVKPSMTYHFDGGADFVGICLFVNQRGLSYAWLLWPGKMIKRLIYWEPLPKLIIHSSLMLERIRFILSRKHKLVVMRDRLREVQFERL